MMAAFEEDYKQPGALKMRSIDIKGFHGWQSWLSFEDGEKAVHDYRGKELSYERRKLTDVDRSTYTFPLPPFENFDVFWQRISMYLRNEGFGAFA
jgi:hypothetical protein